MPLAQILYASAAKFKLSERELDALLRTSAERNLGNGITGLLLYSDGNFMQVLEGEADVVEATYQRIAQDPRHHLLYRLGTQAIDQREFSAWHMGLVRLSPQEALTHPALVAVGWRGLDPEQIAAEPGSAFKVMRTFSQG